jgi:hypothetical protein
MELIYGYLDADVAKWLKETAPKPIGRQNYHQWLSSQYGLKTIGAYLDGYWDGLGLSDNE